MAESREVWVDAEPDFSGSQPFLVLDDLRVERGAGPNPFVLEIERLRIPAGSFTAMLGGSGIGKTTLLTILGLLRGPDEEADLRMRCAKFALCGRGGEDDVIVYEDLDENGAGTQLSPRERERLRREWIGFCLQGGELVPSLTLGDNCGVPAHLCGLPDASERAAAHLQSLGMIDSAIGNQINKLPGELSGGQRQRGVVARALAHSPRMILLDEPTAALDRGTAEEAIDLLRGLAREHGQTVVMVTHDRALAEAYADCIIELDLAKKKHSRISRCRVRADPGEETPGEDKVPVSEGPTRSATPWRYHVQLGLMDAIGPLFHRFRRRAREADAPPPPLSTGVRFLLQLVQNSAVVVAIAMLVLFLRGMRSGLIEDFRTALRKSPNARRIALFGTFFPQDLIRIQASHPDIESVVPVARPTVSLSDATASRPPGDEDRLSRVTLHGLVVGDPMTTLLDPDRALDALEPDQIVLSQATAAALGVGVGARVQAWAQRFLDEFGDVDPDPKAATLRVFHIVQGQDLGEGTAWVHFSFTRAISQFQAGLPVKTEWLDWPGAMKRLEPRYRAFILFVRSDKEGLDALPRSDREVLRMKSFRVEPLEDAARADLLGALFKSDEELAKQDAAGRANGGTPLQPLRIFRCSSQRDESLRAAQLRVERDLRSGGLFLPWNDPLEATLEDGRPIRIIGCSFKRAGNWLRAYMRPLPRIFKWSDTHWAVVVADGGEDGPRRVRLGSREGAPALTLAGQAVPPREGEGPWGVVSSQLLGRLHAVSAEVAEVDPEKKVIYRKVAREEYGQVNVFPDDVFSVPEILASLKEDGYHATAKTNELREIQGYTRVLGYIVRVTSILAGVIALLTIAIVFHDVGRSKKRVLATLRIMGLTQAGAFTLLMVRGVLVALIAGILLLVVGSAGSALLNTLAGRSLCLLTAADYASVLIGILIVCVAGTYLPARAVSRTEPVVALQEAEQQG